MGMSLWDTEQHYIETRVYQPTTTGEIANAISEITEERDKWGTSEIEVDFDVDAITFRFAADTKSTGRE